ESRRLTAVFWSATGRLVIYPKTDEALGIGSALPADSRDRQILQIAVIPFQTNTPPATIRQCKILRNAGDEAVLEVSYSATGSEDVSAVFSFGKTEAVEVKPGSKLKGIRLFSPVEYGVVPGFVGDDLIFDPAKYPSSGALCIPSENLFLGLLQGEDHLLVMTWPTGKQQLK